MSDLKFYFQISWFPRAGGFFISDLNPNLIFYNPSRLASSRWGFFISSTAP